MKKQIIKRPAGGWQFERVTTHPGEMLREEFLKPLGMSAHQLALRTRMPATRIGEILHGRRSVTTDTALRLGRFFSTSPEFWLNMQLSHDLTKVRLESGAAIDRDVQPLDLQHRAA